MTRRANDLGERHRCEAGLLELPPGLNVSVVGTWYHGTSRELADSMAAADIARSGLRSRYYGANYQGGGFPLHHLARQRHQTGLPGRDTLIILQVPMRKLTNI
jgi:hypothetical protein